MSRSKLCPICEKELDSRDKFRSAPWCCKCWDGLLPRMGHSGAPHIGNLVRWVAKRARLAERKRLEGCGGPA